MKKNMMYGVIGALILLGVGIGIFISRQEPKKIEQVQKKEEVDAIPTVDSSTVVTLKSLQGNKEILLEGKGVPSGTSSIDYELSYDTQGQGKQGVIGTISDITGNTFEKQMTLGTCSSGRCVYHEVIGSIQVTLKFTGDYGERILVKEFSL
ncbi:hypothetical protein COV87_03145 [Candidatus Roizmanbacteria bacterium CG11_big_fil_rev_8_21_14_0_20_37_16]|uniref:Uncharacterized protein n=2 Tax=Candidatus Roizmaniibacteriota TaxID=1752723 RepID=A0A2H0KJR1_9BACT|nr:MAG: hypothetical protein COV87_03145 [Candidatus Roizmanbacteria bacterium CG11_big_fil_rev_8_21_14_0_20_37_16]